MQGASILLDFERFVESRWKRILIEDSPEVLDERHNRQLSLSNTNYVRLVPKILYFSDKFSVKVCAFTGKVIVLIRCLKIYRFSKIFISHAWKWLIFRNWIISFSTLFNKHDNLLFHQYIYIYIWMNKVIRFFHTCDKYMHNSVNPILISKYLD